MMFFRSQIFALIVFFIMLYFLLQENTFVSQSATSMNIYGIAMSLAVILISLWFSEKVTSEFLLKIVIGILLLPYAINNEIYFYGIVGILVFIFSLYFIKIRGRDQYPE